MAQNGQLSLLVRVFRVSLGLALLLGTAGLAALLVGFALTPIDVWHRGLLMLLALFFGLLALAVWNILIFPRECQLLIRVVTGVLGVGGAASVAFNTYSLVSSFGFWKLLLSVLGVPGTALFLFWAFHGDFRRRVSRSGGEGGKASALVTWPNPTRPPVLVAAAAEALPRQPESPECRGADVPRI